MNPHERLKHHVTGAIERGEGTAITEILPACHERSPLYKQWCDRVKELEDEGCSTSDAQSIADTELDPK